MDKKDLEKSIEKLQVAVNILVTDIIEVERDDLKNVLDYIEQLENKLNEDNKLINSICSNIGKDFNEKPEVIKERYKKLID